MQKIIATAGFLGVFVWLAPGCSGSNAGACQKDSDCGAGEYCDVGICKQTPGTTGSSAAAASSTSSSTGGGTGAAASGTASGGSTGLGTSTGSSTGTSSGGNGTTGGTSSGAGSTGSTSGGADAGNGVYCKPCTQQSDCGAAGNLCVPLGDGNGYCGTDCSQTGMCTEAGADCVPIYALDGGVLGQDCIPGSNACPTANDGGTSDGGASSDGGSDPYCQPCTQPSDGGFPVCADGALCVTPDEVAFFCAPDCTATLECSEANSTCYPLNDGSGDVCAPTAGLCPGSDPYCFTCSANTDCGGNGAVCTTLDGFDYFCAPDCSKTQLCNDVGADCEQIEDVNQNAADGCVPDSEFCPAID